MFLKALLVEDSSTIRETLVPTMRELANVDVCAFAETAQDANQLLLLNADDFDVIVVDLFLRQGSGLDVLRTCQQRPPNRKVVVLTNYATADMRRRCGELGADAIFDKSTELDDFFDFCISLGSSGQGFVA